ncbi:MAG: class I SAM-dependent methyltransferase [Candidatus Vogelbacteria bacterium]|nr:class I SAM-dependent methyltransferase [Candidatus Vogelbacteria bacterium]
MFSDPQTVVNLFDLTEGMTVADFGAGSGAYALALARKVGPRGKVYAVDVQNNLLERLAREARNQKLSNVHIAWGNIEKLGGSKLADGLADVVLLANVLFLAEAKYSAVLEAKRVLRPGGRIILIDWTRPPAGETLKPDEAKKIFAEAGFKPEREFPAGDQHYGIIFIKP